MRVCVRGSKEASDVRDSAVLVKEALEEAERVQATASQAIRQANSDIKDTNKLLSSVGRLTDFYYWVKFWFVLMASVIVILFINIYNLYTVY